ncbi:TPA: ORF6N domain-containing protein [Escherichia albertii]|uniref:ORF6N domain-containing protein n=1 Tax=Escherichia coli TaxID=562 RepID=UPI0029084681|nr:ORF6N domain-containing protein [Escherichia coli]HEB1312091.1 ORF6N domain-containing protein [Escherichia albertii]HDP7423948.1 ORF6N domain-containing protein [Escherichia coli]HEB1316615.1 ORF6N domain-containing protein [Escherichia albertii]HEB1335138.1 ORF6N domain-containing protein [Escherichia albertii]
MKTLPTVNTLQPILHNQIPVITTELLAKLYGCSVECLHRNHHRNKSRFTEGKHFIVVKGTDLQSLKISLRDFQTIANNVRKLILWTERGAARHAKMLETDQAWDVFERLEDCYFNQNAQTAATVTVSPNNAREVVDTLNAKPMFYIKVCNNEPLTTSADVAQAFSTTNNSIVMAIDALRIPRTAAARHFFKEQRPLEGSDREITIYRMTKDGFTLLMESIDGPSVKDIKLAYIEAFNAISSVLKTQYERDLAKRLYQEKTIIRAATEHNRLLTEPNYRKELIKEFDKATGKTKAALNLPAMTQENVISALLLDLLRNARALISFDENLNPQLKLLPPTGKVVDQADHNSILSVLDANLPARTLQELIKISADKLAASAKP